MRYFSLLVFTSLVLLLHITACGDAPETDPVAQAEAMTTVATAPVDLVRDGCPTKPSGPDSLQIPDSCARQRINNWLNYRTQLAQGKVSPDTNLIVRSFRLHPGELRAILDQLREDDDIWITLALVVDEQGKTSADAIMAGKYRDGVAAADDDGWGYFDFTTPCPDFCDGEPSDE